MTTDLGFWVLQMLNALQLSMLLFLLSVGLTVIFGLMHFVNLAHGSLYAFGAYMAASFAGVLGYWGGFFLAPLAVATLRALLAFSPDAFRAHLKDFFPLLTALISCEYAPPEVQRALSDLFAQRIGPMLAS